MNQNAEDKKIGLSEIVARLRNRKRKFLLLWCVTFVLSCIWILPQPRYYTCTVKLAPEGLDLAGGYAAIASTLGLGGAGMSSDAIYPTLYPELFDSPEFMVGLFDIEIETDDGSIRESYGQYMAKHQKKNWLTRPFTLAKRYVTQLFEQKLPEPKAGQARNPFKLSVRDFKLVAKIKSNISCATDTRTSVVTITVKDQDRQVCALMADSIMAHLQSFITSYRTKKARQDMDYFSHMCDSTRSEYEQAQSRYAKFNETHRDISSPIYSSMADKLRNEADLKLNTYNSFMAQYDMARAKLQEKTPSFTTLIGATVPIKPAGPKRMLFVAFMLVLATLSYAIYILRDDMGSIVSCFNSKGK